MKKRSSNAIICGIILALSGGSMDAYSYLYRGHVFANAQTGNMILFGVNLANGDLSTASNYLWPFLSFTVGVMISDFICERKNYIKIHWRQIAFLLEALILTGVAFLPKSYNFIANTLISFACGIQVESFRTIHGNNIATTMCIGNLRNGTYYFGKYLKSKKQAYLRKTLLYFTIIISFVAGAIIESNLIRFLSGYAILFSSALLLIALCLMFHKTTG